MTSIHRRRVNSWSTVISSSIHSDTNREPTQKLFYYLLSTMEWVKGAYNNQYESWVPWAEDKYLAWFGQNKTSYVAKGMSSIPDPR